MSSIPRKIVGGLLAGLLALFAAVVVATPAWAVAPSLQVTQTGAELATYLFGTLPVAGVSVTGNTIKVTGTVATDGTSSEVFQLVGDYELVVDGTLNVKAPLVFTGNGNLTISGSGTIQATDSCTEQIIQVGYIDGDAETHAVTQLYPGSLTVDGPVTIQNEVDENIGAIMVRQGSATVGGGATITSAPSDEDAAGAAAIQVGSGGYTTGCKVATLTVGDATISGYNGINATNTASVTVGDGAKISGLGEGEDNTDGIGILMLAQLPNTELVLNVNGGTISGTETGVDSGYGQNGEEQPILPGLPADKVTADFNVSGGTITGMNGAVTEGAGGFINNFSNADVDITGGTITGNPSYTTSAEGAQVSGGQFSTPVDPDVVDPSIQAMGVIPGKGGTSTYGYFPTAAAAEAAGATATVPLNSSSTNDIIAVGIIPGTFSTAETPNALVQQLTKLGITNDAADANDLYSKAEAIGENNLFVVYYGSSAPTAVTALLSGTNFPQDMNPSGATSGTNGFNFATYQLSATNPNQGAGTYTISVIGTVPKQEQISVAGVHTIQPTGSSSTGLSDLTTTTDTVFVEADASAEPVDLPELNNAPLSDSSKVMSLGWYQLTPTKAPAAGAVPTSFSAAAYDGDTWTPSAATMTYLTEAYADLPSTGVTGTLAVSPTNVTNTANAAQATLALTIGNKALKGDVYLSYSANIAKTAVTNSDDLATSTADVANGIANYVESTIGASTNTSCVGFVMGASAAEMSSVGTPKATLAKAAEGESNPAIEGGVVTATMDIDCSPITNANLANLTNPVSMTVTLSNLGVTGTATAAVSGTTPTLKQPAAIFSVFQGVAVTSYGNGTFTQTVNADGTVTLTAVPKDGATFIGWQDKLGNTISTNNPWILSKAAVQSLTGGVIAFFEGGSVTPEPPEPPEPPTPEGSVAIYRLYNQATGEHLLSSSSFEVAQLTSGNDWILDGYDKNPQGIAFYDLAATSDGTPIYRLYDYGTGTHLYTASTHEKDVLASQGWHVDFEGGAMFKAPTTSNYPVYRLYNGSLPLNISHLWTASYNEFNTLKNLPESQRWTPEPSVENPVAWWATALPTGPNV